MCIGSASIHLFPGINHLLHFSQEEYNHQTQMKSAYPPQTQTQINEDIKKR